MTADFLGNMIFSSKKNIYRHLETRVLVLTVSQSQRCDFTWFCLLQMSSREKMTAESVLSPVCSGHKEAREGVRGKNIYFVTFSYTKKDLFQKVLLHTLQE